MDACAKQQMKLKEEILTQRQGDVVSPISPTQPHLSYNEANSLNWLCEQSEILEAVNSLRQRTDGR